MRYLPVFLDLQSGPVLLVGAGDLARAKLRLLTSAGARVRWYATDGNHDLSGLASDDAARIEIAQGDPLATDLKGVIAILCAGAGDIGIAMSVRAKAVGLPVNVTQPNTLGLFSANQYPNLVGNPNGNKSFTQWFNTSAFQIAAPDTLGDAPRAAFFGPGLNIWNIAIGR